MWRVCTCLAALALSASSAHPQTPARDTPSAAPSGTAVIRGKVTLAGTDQPLGRVDVRASSPALKTPRAVKTDADGRYEIAELPAGRYIVSAVKANFVTAAFGQRRPLGPGVPFDLANRQVATRVDFALARAGVITGRVFDEFGDPISDVQIATLRYQYVNGERRLAPTPGRGVTNDIGEFRLFGLPPGEYFVSATLRSYMSSVNDDRSGYLPTYYPGTGNAQQAQRISIAPGQTVSGIGMALLPVHTSRISGVAIDATGKPLTSGAVIATARVGMMNMGGQSGPIMANGLFTIGGLTPGDYILRTGGMPGEPSAVLPVSVNGADISDVQLVVSQLGAISGRVVFDADVNLPTPSTVRIAAQRPDPMLGVGAPLAGPAKDDYTFEIKVMPGHAIIRGSQPSSDWRFKRVTLNGEDVSDTGVEIPANGTLSNLVIEFTNKLNELSGTVVDAVEPALDAWVVIFSQDRRRWTPPSRFVVATRPDRDNHFRTRLMAGDYYAILVDDVEPGEWTDPEYLARVSERATAFSIADGEKRSLDLRISASR